MIDPGSAMATAAGVTMFGLALAEMLAKRKLIGNDWPNSIPANWPEVWRLRFAQFKPNPSRTAIGAGMKKRVLDLCRENRESVKDFAWATRDGQRVTAGTMAWSHLLNTIKFCARNKNWGPWAYFVAEHRMRLRRCRKASGRPTSKLTMVEWDAEWEKTIGASRRSAQQRTA